MKGYPQTAETIAAAKMAQQIERAHVSAVCGVVFDEDGQIYWTTEQVEKEAERRKRSASRDTTAR